MTSFYDELKQQDGTTPAPQADAPSFYDQLKQQDEEQGRLRMSVMTAAETTPEKAAQQKYLAETTGLPLEIVKTAEGQAKAIAKFQEISQYAATSPVLRQKLQQPDFAALAQNDGANLSGIERTLQVIGGTLGRAVSGATVGIGRFQMNAAATIDDYVAAIANTAAPLIDGVLPINPLRQLGEAAGAGAEAMRYRSKRAQDAVDFFLPKGQNDVESGLYSGAESAGFNLATLPAAIAGAMARGPAFAAQIMGVVAGLAQGTESYNEARNKGMGVIGATTYAAPDAVAEYAFERWFGHGLLDDIAKKSTLGKILLHSVGREVAGEELTTIAQKANEWVRLNPEKSWSDFLAEMPSAMLQTAVAAVVGGAIQGGAMKGIQKIAEAHDQSIVAIDQVSKLQEMLRLAAGSDLLEKDPQSFSQFVQAAADETAGAPKSVWVDGRTFVDALHQSGVDQQALSTLMPSVTPETVREALAANSPIEIPIGELTTALAGSPLEQAIVPHLRVQPDALSLTEAKQQQEQAQQFLQQEAQRVLQQATDVAQANAQQESVRQNIAEQVHATGRFSREVADNYAKVVSQFYTVMAHRMGTTPEKLYADHLQYKVQGQGQGVLAQRKAPTVDAFNDLGGGFTIDNGKLLRDGKAVGDIKLEMVTPEKGRPHLVVRDIRIDSKGNGTGTMALAQIMGKASEHDLPVALTSEGMLGKKHQKRLRDYYQRLGFKKNTGETKVPGVSEEFVWQQPADTLRQDALPSTLDVDGVQRPTVNSEGRPLAQTEEGVRNFWKWFGDSKVVDADGKPLVVYHGTERAGFDRFDTDLAGGNTGRKFEGFYFSSSKLGAETYSGTRAEAKVSSDPDFDVNYDGEPGNYAVYLKLANPVDVDFQEQGWDAEVDGFMGMDEVTEWAKNTAQADGVIARNIVDEGRHGQGYGWGDTTYVVFSPEQIKSAIGNDGTFDANDPSILSQGQARGTYDIGSMTTVLNGTADLSTFLHETGHFFLDALRRMVASGTATPQVQAMYEQALKGLGVDQQQWEAWHDEYASTGQISEGMRAAHEKFAESFELYLMTGQAPNIEAKSLFRTFAEWLKRVYKSMADFAAAKGLQLDPDLKSVMDRMLATDEQIAEAEQVAGLLPDLDATGEAREKLTARSLRDLQWAVNARNKTIAKLQKAADKLRAALRDEVKTEVEQMPVYRLETLLRTGRLPEVPGENMTNAQRKALDSTAGMTIKLGLPQLKEMYGDGPAAPWRYLQTGKNGLAATEGVHPDVLADAFGFQSGDELVRALLSAEPMANVIEGMTDQRMLERHGDLATPEAVAQAATEAVHNEARARALATELAAQREMLGTRRDTGETNANGAKRTVNVLLEAAKQFAATVIGRRTVKDLKKAEYAHLQAERRAGREWEKATAKGDTEAAVRAKQDQMLNNAAVRAAQQAQDTVREALDLFRKVSRGSTEDLVKKGRDPDVVSAARAVLAAYGLGGQQAKNALEYLELVQKNDPSMYAAVAPSVMAAMGQAKLFDDLTVDEVTALRDEVESLWYLARRSRQMEVDGTLIDREEVQEQLHEALLDRGIPDSMPGDTSAITPQETMLRKFGVFKAAATRVENWASNMGAAFTRFVFQPVKEAADRYRADKAVYIKELHELLLPLASSLKKGQIAAPELNYVFGKDESGVAMAEILHAILHTGNESNLHKLLIGREWAVELPDGSVDTSRWDAFITRLASEGVLTPAHYDAIQGIWDLLEKTKPLAQKTHREVFGRYFAEVTANSFVDPFGVTRRGGYVPAIADTRIVRDAATRELAETENQSMAFAFPSTNRGFTKSRVKSDRPLLLDLRVLAQHLDKVLLFSHMESPIRDVRRVLTAKGVAYGLNRIDPAAFDNVLTPWLNRASRQQVEAPVAGDAGLMKFFSGARSRAGMSAMFANVANAAQQITGFSLAALKVKPTYLMSATADMVAHRKQMIEAVTNASVYMKERMENDVSNAEDAIREILLDPSVYEKSQMWVKKHAYFLQQMVDNSMGPIIWTAAFNQAVAQGQSDKDAVRFADSVIRKTQGSTLPEDVSRIEGGNAFVRMFTQFSGYFNMQANLLGEEYAKTVRELGVKKGAGKLLYITTLGFLAPAWVAEAIMQAFRGGPDDEDKDGEYLDDWIAAVFGWSTLRGATAMIPAVGPVINGAVNAWNAKPYDDRLGGAPAITMIEAAVRSPASVYKAIVDDASAQKAVRDVAALLSLVTSLPVAAAARPVGYLAGVMTDAIHPTGTADAARGAITGYASPDSK